jgi:hypothetical protein
MVRHRLGAFEFAIANVSALDEATGSFVSSAFAGSGIATANAIAMIDATNAQPPRHIFDDELLIETDRDRAATHSTTRQCFCNPNLHAGQTGIVVEQLNAEQFDRQRKWSVTF